MWSQLSELKGQLKAAAHDTRRALGGCNCAQFPLFLCALLRWLGFFLTTLALLQGLPGQKQCAGLHLLSLCPTVLPIASPSSSLHWMGAPPSPPEDTAAALATSVSTLRWDMVQCSLLTEHLRAVPGRMSHSGQGEIKLLELSKSNFHNECLPCGLHVGTVPDSG